MQIYLSAGHGGADVGATYNGAKERDEAIAYVNSAVALLDESERALVTVVPHELGLVGGVNYINGNAHPDTDLAIEIHLNANSGEPGSGTETWIGDSTTATAFNNEIVRVLCLPNRGIKDSQSLYFNRVTRCRSFLVELGFINNPHDLQMCREKAGIAIASAIKLLISNQTMSDTQTEVLPELHPHELTLTAKTNLRARTSPKVNETNIARLLSLGSKFTAEGFVIGDSVKDNALWWKLKGENVYVWSGGTNAIPELQSKIKPVEIVNEKQELLALAQLLHDTSERILDKYKVQRSNPLIEILKLLRLA